MKRSILAWAMMMVCGAGFLPAQKTELTSLPAIHALSNAQAAARAPVDFEATVTYYRDYERTLFVQDGDTAIFILASTDLKVMAGDRLEVRGHMEPSFRPIVVSSDLRRLGHGSVPPAAPATIARARANAGVFGLIFVDLDEFKQVNDVYGHHAGDLYLQEVAAQMKRQLRGADLLARVGGDEFAVLVPMVHNRSDVEENALRLEHCFAATMTIDGYVLQGSASVDIALYPEDGSTKDSLMSAADAAM